MIKDVFVSAEELDRQRDFSSRVARLLKEEQALSGRQRTAFVDCYGCQQNEADAENMRGMLDEMGYIMITSPKDADVVIINTCAVREHAEMRVYGNVGALSHLKKKRPDMIIAVGGCMPQQERVALKLKKSFPYVDIVFGTHALWRLPELVYEKITEGGRYFETADEDGRIAEGLPTIPKDNIRGWVSVMYGCNNFCSYCIVPYVRGRERSRRPDDVIEDVKRLVNSGCREINLLGQNVNSYGNDAGYGVDFPELLQRVCAVPGDFIVRFMTSHPKDANRRLIDVIADEPKMAPQLHLPVQSGSDRILSLMNRKYTAEKYMELIEYAKSRIPGICLTSDIIVGFPGENEEDFEATINLIKKVRYHSLFTFVFSPRPGTPAAEMQDTSTKDEKKARFQRLVDTQNAISEEVHSAYVGSEMRILTEGKSRAEEWPVSGRTDGGRPVYLKTAAGPGEFIKARVERCSPWALYACDIRGEDK